MTSTRSGRPPAVNCSVVTAGGPSGDLSPEIRPEPWIVRSSELAFAPASHEDPRDPGCLKKVLARRDDLPPGRVQMLNWTMLPPGRRFEEHFHEDMLEVFIIVSGTVEVLAGDKTHVLHAGDAWFVPPKFRHQMLNRADNEALYVVFGISAEQGGKTVVVHSDLPRS